MDLAGKQIGNYVAKHQLGSGGMGVVYLCEHPLIRRRVAAKVLHEELAASEDIVRRLFAEARAANEISSEHVIEVLDFGHMTEEGRERVYLVMELLEGEGLGNRLWRTGLTVDESLHIVSQCTEALEASHKAGIVHRDLKPENIFLVERRGDPNFVKILDFGIAKVTGSTSMKTRTGVLLGTPAYMSPEQCRGSGAVDARADVYSLGIVLYELTTGDVPFNGNGYGQVLLSQMTETPKLPSSVNKDLPKIIEAIIMRALEKDPAKRFQSMAELGEAVAEAQTILQARQPVQQIPRKGLHQRATMVSNGPRKDGPDAQPTPIDTSIPASMAKAAPAAMDAPTQMMAVVADESDEAAPAATVIDREVPAEVRAHQAALFSASTQLKQAPTLTPITVKTSTGPQGVVGPPSSSARTVIREVVVAPVPERMRPTSQVEELPARSTLARNIVLFALVVGGLLVAAALVLRPH